MAETMTLELSCQPGQRDALAKILRENVLGDTAKYDGALRVEMWLDETDENRILLYETWESRNHQAKYFAWRVESGALDSLGPMLAGPPVTTWYRVDTF